MKDSNHNSSLRNVWRGFILLFVAILVGFLMSGHCVTTYDYIPSAAPPPMNTNDYSRTDVYHEFSKDAMIHGWFYHTKHKSRAPLVIISHGLGSQKDMGLENYAVAFAKVGISSLVIDYRSFGLSTDKYRNFISPWRHIEDIESIVMAVHDGILLNNSVDSNKIALWGSSLAGGHGIMVASKLKDKGFLKGIVAQVPHLDGKAASLRGIKSRGLLDTLRLLCISVSDIIRGILGFSPLYVKIAGLANETAYMPMTEQDLQTYYSKHPKTYLGNWKNLAPARTLLFMSRYNPINEIPKLTVPVLMIGASNDDLCPVSTIEKAFNALQPNRLHRMVTKECTHFDIYVGPVYEELKAEMIKFLQNIFV